VLEEYPNISGDARGRPPKMLSTIRKGSMHVINVEEDGYEVLDLVSKTSDKKK